MKEDKKTKIWLRLMRLGAAMGCHQMPERSFFYKGYQFPLCARCTGILKCPNCGSDNCHYVSNTKVHSRGFGTGEACCGFLLMGPVGLLCGFCGMDTDSTVKEYWVCENCGNKFSQRKAEQYMKIEEQKLKNILFYREVQKKSVVEPFETEMGERIDEGNSGFCSERERHGLSCYSTDEACHCR